MTYHKKTLISLSATALASLFLVAANSVNANEVGTAKGQATYSELTSTIDVPAGYKYVGGDEFNGDGLDTSKWFAYGSKKVTTEWTSNAYYAKFGQPQGMVQVYSPGMLKIEDQADGSRALEVKSVRTDEKMTVPNGSTQSVWKSGAFTSRDADTYYPVFSRIEVRMKTDNFAGLWHGLWVTSYKGASTAEFDLGEFFTRAYGDKEVNQTLHIWDNQEGKTEVNVKHDGVKDWIRHYEVPGSIKDEYHVYAVEVEPKGEDEAVISLSIDGKVSYTFTTDRRGADRYNKFITDAQKEGRLDTGTNIMFTGGVGGTISEVLYPNENLNEAESTIDWIRVFVKDDVFTNVNETLTKTTFKIPGSMRTQAYFLQDGKKVYSIDVEHKTDEKPAEPHVYIEKSAKIKHIGFWEDTHVARFERFIPVNYIIPVEFRDQAYFIQDGKKVHTYHQQIPVGTTYRQAGIPRVHFAENSHLRFVSYNWQRWDEKLDTNIGGRGITAKLAYR